MFLAVHSLSGFRAGLPLGPSATASAVPKIILEKALTEIHGSAINHRGAFRAWPCSFFHENPRFLSHHGHGGACAFGELGICRGVMQSGDPFLITPTSTHMPKGTRHLQPQRLGLSRKSGYKQVTPSERSQPMNRVGARRQW